MRKLNNFNDKKSIKYEEKLFMSFVFFMEVADEKEDSKVGTYFASCGVMLVDFTKPRVALLLF